MRKYAFILMCLTVMSSCATLNLGGGQNSEASEQFGLALEQTQNSVGNYINNFWGGEDTRDSLRSQLERELEEPLYNASLQVFTEWEEHNRSQGTSVNYEGFSVPAPKVKGELAQLLSNKVLNDISSRFFEAAETYVSRSRKKMGSEEARQAAARKMSSSILGDLLREVESFLDKREKASYKKT